MHTRPCLLHARLVAQVRLTFSFVDRANDKAVSEERLKRMTPDELRRVPRRSAYRAGAPEAA